MIVGLLPSALKGLPVLRRNFLKSVGLGLLGWLGLKPTAKAAPAPAKTLPLKQRLRPDTPDGWALREVAYGPYTKHGFAVDIEFYRLALATDSDAEIDAWRKDAYRPWQLMLGGPDGRVVPHMVLPWFMAWCDSAGVIRWRAEIRRI